ncbi:MAG: hypothetical protein KC618_03375, partial [Candidatus Omnitrophica bacterium]|nr:hypothetical protein [Candidatus Omnitrophota bacterium]
MDGYFYNRRKSLIFKVLCSILVVFFFTLSVVPPGYAQMVPMSLNLPAPGAVLPISPGYAPTLVKGLAINPQNPLEFDFFVDPGDSGMKGEEFKTEANKLIKYFLASLTIAEEDLWVNLSPYEEGRIIPDTFGQTEMGRDLLAQDYILKQLTASMMYPENELGQKFWNKVYDEAQAKFGTREIPMSTFNKIWIVPERATIYINGNNVFVADTHLKVLLEEDYVALRKDDTAISGKSNESLTDDDMEEISETSSAVIREVLLPAIEKEINEGQNFANLRQINNSLTLAVWYKKNLKESLLGQVYADQGKVKGIEQDDVRANREIYNRYVEAFKTGVYDYIKEEYDPSTQSLVSRKYFSGGFGLNLTQTTPAGTVRELSYAERINEVRKDINSNRSIDNIAVKKLASTTDDISRFQVMLEAPRSTPQDRAMIINNNDGGESLFQNLKGSTDQELEVARENNFQENIKRIRRGEEAFIVLKNLSGNLKKEFGPDIHDEVVALLKDSGFEVEVISTKTVNEEEADGWYGVHKGRILENGDNLYEKLVEVNTQGPSVMLLVKKEGYQGDALYKYLQDEIRTKVRQKYNRSQKDYDNIMHVSDTVKSATEEFSKINRPRLLLSATNQISNKAVNDPVVGPILNEFLASYKFMQNHDRLDAFAGRNSEKRAEIINEQDTEIYGPVFDTLSQIAELREQGKVNPEGVKLRLSKNDAQVTQADQNLDGRRARVGYLPMKGDPWQAGHIFVILEAVAKFGLDKVVISIDNGDYRKDELSSLTIRQAITKKVLENLGVMVEFTTMTAEEESLWKADGEQSMFFLSQLNKDIDIDWFYMGGSDHANWTKMIEQTDSETGAKKMVEDLDIPSKLVRNIKQGLYGFFDGGRHTINVIFSERPGVKPLTEDQLNALRREVGKELPNSSQLREMGKIVQPMNTSSSRVRKDGDFWTVLMSAYQFADAFQFWGLQTPEVQAEQEVLGKDLITLVQQGLDNTAEKDIIIKQVEERLSNATGVGMNIFDFFLMRKLSEDLQNREWLME